MKPSTENRLWKLEKRIKRKSGPKWPDLESGPADAFSRLYYPEYLKTEKRQKDERT